MRILNPTTPHTPDHTRLTIETTLTDIITTGLDLPTDRVQVGYFAAPGLAIVTITGITSGGLVEGTTRRASQVLTDAGYGRHFWDSTRPGAVTGPVYKAEIAVRV